MALPQLNTVNYDMVIPSTGEQIKYRPFVVREEKVLLTAMESGDAQQITNAIVLAADFCTYLTSGRDGCVSIYNISLRNVEN